MNNALTSMMLLALSAPGVFAGRGEISPAVATRHDGALMVPTRVGDVLLATRDLDIDITLPSGKQWKGRLVVFFDSTTGWYLSRLTLEPGYTATEFISHSKIFVTPERIVAFSPSFRSIMVRESTEKASSLNDAEGRALRQHTAHLAEFPKQFGIVDINLIQIGWTFQQPPLGAGPPTEVRILRVAQQDGKWELIMEAEWKVKVILNDKFQILETTRID